MGTRLICNWVLALGLIWLTPTTARSSESIHDYDPENARDINELCAGCHGEFGEGGGDGEYPRLAGLPEKYLVDQLRAFKSKERQSLTMGIWATDRELPEPDLLDISRYLSEVELFETMPDFAPGTSSYEKLLISKRVKNVARYEGDFAEGESIYRKQCRKCHGKEGKGQGSRPFLTGQDTEYLRRQIVLFRNGERSGKEMASYLDELTADQIENLLAYLSIADD